MKDIKHEELTTEKMIETWSELGFLDGCPDEKKGVLTRNYENMLHYLVYDNECEEKEIFNTSILSVLRRITLEMPIVFDCRMLVRYLFNTKTEDLMDYFISDRAKDYFEKNKDKDILKTFFFGNKIEKGEEWKDNGLEDELCVALSEYIIHKLKK